jgi:xanthine/CO dehydrogenase XdhC/CoxF family maturation factor
LNPQKEKSQMRKTLLLATILFLCAGVAQAQAVYEAFGNAVMAREGGAGEKAGAIVLFLRSGDHNGGIVTVRYSAPLAAETMAMVSTGTVATDVDEGTVTVTMPSSGTATVTISDVRLDLREATAPVTATFSGNENAFVSGVATVISAIEDALEVESTSAQILTRGTDGSATVTIKEAFASAFTAEADILLTLVGVPNKASLTVSHAGHPTVAALQEDDTLDDADVAGDVTLNVGTATAMIVDTGDATENALSLTGDGKDIDITIDFTMPATTGESLSLVLDLDARSSVKDLALPLAAGMVSASATMAPTKKPTTVAADSEYFTANFIAAEKASFTFAPASCTLLYPYVVSLPDLGWNTGLAITNPTAGAGTALGGAVTFTLFANGAEMPMTYTTGAGTPGPNALDADGMLAGGNTYTLLLSELLAWVGHEGNLTGHLYVKTNFTGCRGVGWVTDFGTVNQAYLPYFGDNLDEGGVPNNQ